MHVLEKVGIAIRHSRWLEHADGLWSGLRPVYDAVLPLMFPHGVERTINGSDRIRLLPCYRSVGEVYEPEVWRHLMQCVQAADVVADVGAYLGLYTLALARRVQPGGKVVAFEPDPDSFATLQQHVALNGLAQSVECCHAAVGCQDGFATFAAGRGSESRIIAGSGPSAESLRVRVVRLDSHFGDVRLDVLKIDVEGYEEAVLRGAEGILSDSRHRPRAIYIEVHPYAWPEAGTTSDSLLGLLRRCGYEAFLLTGEPARTIEHYGEIVALDPAAGLGGSANAV